MPESQLGLPTKDGHAATLITFNASIGKLHRHSCPPLVIRMDTGTDTSALTTAVTCMAGMISQTSLAITLSASALARSNCGHCSCSPPLPCIQVDILPCARTVLFLCACTWSTALYLSLPMACSNCRLCGCSPGLQHLQSRICSPQCASPAQLQVVRHVIN